MRKPSYRLAILALLMLPAGGAAQVDPRADETPPDQPLFHVPITQRTVENALRQMSLEMAERYGLDDEQVVIVQDIMVERMIPFIRENAPRLQRLVSEFMEVQTGFEAPEPDRVADWAQRALPLMDEFRKTVEGVSGEMRPYLTDEQQLQLDAEMAGFQVGLKLARGKVARWSEGGFDPEVEWPGSPNERRLRDREERRRAEREMRRAEERVLASGGEAEARVAEAGGTTPRHMSSPGAPDSSKQPPDEWTTYVENFIKRYELNGEQQDQAWRILKVRREARDAYLSRADVARDMESVQKLIREATSEEEKAAAHKRLERLEDPVKRYFAQLKDGLDRIPTRDQRLRASRKDTSQAPAAGPRVAADGRAADVRNKKEDPSSP